MIDKDTIFAIFLVAVLWLFVILGLVLLFMGIKIAFSCEIHDFFGTFIGAGITFLGFAIGATCFHLLVGLFKE